MMISTVMCDSHTCQRPGCSREAGCQGHVWREQAPAHFQKKAERLVVDAARAGLVVTIEQRPLRPLAMGNHETVVSVRPARNGEAAK